MTRVPPAILVSGTHSGVGKTTVSFALMSSLRSLGFAVQPFKVGPDFIDPGYHRLVTGRDSINLDLWMMGLTNIRASLAEYSAGADIAVVEGMGALFDGENGTSERGSSAYLARKLQIPVILVVDIWGMTRSTGAMIQGFIGFDPRVRILGFILNRAGSHKHYEMVANSLPGTLKRLLLGYLLHSEDLHVPERHLGLLTVEENSRMVGMLQNDLPVRVRQTLGLDGLIKKLDLIKRRSTPPPPSTRTRHVNVKKVRVGVARDKAFCFYYAQNLRMLEQQGAELVYFSPMVDSTLPPSLHGLYFGGGYPESFADILSTNLSIKSEILSSARSGMPIYAECGGFMYLARSVRGFDGKTADMVSLFPVDIAMDKNFLSISYVRLRTMRRSLLGPRGTEARGQEFHQSRIISSSAKKGCYSTTTSAGQVGVDGFTQHNALASYIHIHFQSNPHIPVYFVAKCIDYKSLMRRRTG